MCQNHLAGLGTAGAGSARVRRRRRTDPGAGCFILSRSYNPGTSKWPHSAWLIARPPCRDMLTGITSARAAAVKGNLPRERVILPANCFPRLHQGRASGLPLLPRAREVVSRVREPRGMCLSNRGISPGVTQAWLSHPSCSSTSWNFVWIPCSMHSVRLETPSNKECAQAGFIHPMDFLLHAQCPPALRSVLRWDSSISWIPCSIPSAQPAPS